MGHFVPIGPESDLDEEEQVSVVPGPQLENKTIHILGLGNVGKYIAHTLASLPHGPPITLLMHRPLVMQRWHDEGAAVRLVKHGELHVQSDFNIESAAAFRREHPDQVFPHFGKNLEHSAEPPNTVIDTLIVTTDSWATLPALEAIKHRLRQTSTICFIQDGLGIAEKVNAGIFTDPDRRPTYVLGRISHHIVSTERHFTIIEKEPGTLLCSKLPQRSLDVTGEVPISRTDFSWSPQAKHLVGSLSRAPDLNTKPLGHKSYYKVQLQNLAIGCIIGPLSVMYDCSNDQLLFNYNASLTMKQILEEISRVVCSLPELKSLSGVYENFNLQKLQAIVVSAIAKTGRIESRMLQTVRAGKRTNVDYYNGYIIRRGAELGIPCPKNEMIISLVKGRVSVKSKEINGYIPLLGSN
ncbi:6-phosphogluconate dehydrogenase C-terminal domain-like protein [Mollisia scopiformis]|uniref:6-phosphogluconate dehydrogenase C-terminal domain-like protein n=1 Tax=Mollisia scopiformis TaxID=149040 RepID=A0A132B4M6_MOLSC|nr:6-phosphogluconate dehydrogenase C-terminal domain-like protein [Mollisia scopiformis]KUJ07281.1 6-phosphogluconate dehydrogenase C-terminal domain-like protein [Mollisia scopiformis]